LKKIFKTQILTIGTLITVSFSSGQEKDIKSEIDKLIKIRNEIKSTYENNQALLDKIKKEKEELENLKKQLEEQQKKIKEERYKKLAKVFEKMDPELAGEKFSKMESPEDAAYIIYNMNEKKAAAILNNTDPVMVNKIVKILTGLKKLPQ
jgi:flagellar motility protein MotE (MotC chaperone)